MEEFKKNVIDVFNSYKCKNLFSDLKLIPIHDSETIIGFLKPVTFHYKTIAPEYISLFSEWRRKNPEGFATTFEITDKRTEFWLDNILLRRDDRILFVIYSLDNKSIGHIGLSSFNYEQRSCEIDNVVRGVKETSKGMMSLAMRALIKWGVETIHLRNIYLRVLADNTHAVKFYEKNSFVRQHDIPLFKVSKDNEVKWIEEKEFEAQEPDRYYTYMRLTE